ncbi:p53 and DNA damage-regulated protein [Anaeramoeba flamelloides]|nr:p53 and DNA damage-regulated protein [Anaeramoeba flamelloides]
MDPKVKNYLCNIEQLAEEVLTEKQQIIDFDKKRQSNHESLAKLTKKKQLLENNRKIWLCLGDFFMKVESKKAVELIKTDQKQFNSEIKNLNTSIKKKSQEIFKLQGKANLVAGFNLKPIDQNITRPLKLDK